MIYRNSRLDLEELVIWRCRQSLPEVEVVEMPLSSAREIKERLDESLPLQLQLRLPPFQWFLINASLRQKQVWLIFSRLILVCPSEDLSGRVVGGKVSSSRIMVHIKVAMKFVTDSMGLLTYE